MDTNEHISKELFEHVGEDARAREAISRPSLTFMQDAMRRFRQNRVAMFCFILLIFMILMSVLAPILSPFDYREQHYAHTNAGLWTMCDEAGSSGAGHVHIFGTDTLGRDIFTRVWMGGRVSLTIAIVSALVDLVLGSIYGGISGYFGGTVDTWAEYMEAAE